MTIEDQNLARRTFTENSNRTKKGICYYCGKPGHFKRECRKLLAEQETRQNDSDTQDARKGVDGRHQAAIVTSCNEPGMYERAWAASRQVRTVASRNKAQQTDPWYLDSAATSHMTNCQDLFIAYKQGDDTVTVADGRQLTSQGQGTIRVQFEGTWVQIHQVLYVPGLQGNLLSIGQLAEKGIECHFSSQGAVLRHNGETHAHASREGRNYVLHPTQGAHEARVVTTDNNEESQKSDSYELWHRRLGHIGDQKMQLLETTTVGVADLARQRRKTCETCALSKSVRSVNRDTPEHCSAQPQPARLCGCAWHSYRNHATGCVVVVPLSPS